MVSFADVYMLWLKKAKPIIQRFAKENKVPKSMLKLLANENVEVLFIYFRRSFSYNDVAHNKLNVIDMCGIKYPLAFILNNKYAYAEAIASLYIEYFSRRYVNRGVGDDGHFIKNLHFMQKVFDEEELMAAFHKKFLSPFQKVKFKMEEGIYWVYSLFTGMKF